MSQPNNTKEIVYSIHNIKSYLSGVKKVFLKRKSDDGTSATGKLCLYKSNSNSETNDTTNKCSLNIPKEKKLFIKFKDLVAEEDDNMDGVNLELALSIKKRRYTNKLKRVEKCNNKINLDNDKDKEDKKIIKISKSMGKIIIGNKEDNNLIKTIKKKILCCY